MAQVIRTVCDPHLDDDEHAGQSFRFTLAGPLVPADLAGPRVIDVCDEVQAQALAPLLSWLAEYSRPDSEQIQATGLACPHCDRTFQRPKSLQGHINRKHASDPQLAAAPADAPAVEAPGAVACGEPGCDRTFTGRRASQARGAHAKRAHGRDGTSPEATRRRQRKVTA